MTKWEYWFAFGPMSCEELNKIGEDGWELTAVIESTETRGRWLYYFKRSLPCPQPYTAIPWVRTLGSSASYVSAVPFTVSCTSDVKEINNGQ